MACLPVLRYQTWLLVARKRAETEKEDKCVTTSKNKGKPNAGFLLKLPARLNCEMKRRLFLIEPA